MNSISRFCSKVKKQSRFSKKSTICNVKHVYPQTINAVTTQSLRLLGLTRLGVSIFLISILQCDEVRRAECLSVIVYLIVSTAGLISIYMYSALSKMAIFQYRNIVARFKSHKLSNNQKNFPLFC